MLRIILTVLLGILVVACGKSPTGEKRADVSFEFQQMEDIEDSGNLAQIITTETKCISIASDRDVNARFAAGFSGAKANGTINVPEGVNKFTLSSYSGQVDANDTTKCTGSLHEKFSVDANIVAGEANTLVLHPLRASWATDNKQAFDPHSLSSAHASIKPFDVQFKSLDFEQDVDPYSGESVRNSYDVHIAYDSASLTMPQNNRVLLPQFSASTGDVSTAYNDFFEKILFDTEQYSGLYSLCSPYPGLMGSTDAAGCNLRVKAVPDTKRSNGDLSDGGLTLVSNLGVYSVEGGVSLLSVGFDPCTYISHESPLSVKSCSYKVQDSTGADITATVRDKFKSTVSSGLTTDEMKIHFVELKVYPKTAATNEGFTIAANENGVPPALLGPSTGNYSFTDPYEVTKTKTSTVSASTDPSVVCYTGADLSIVTTTGNPLSPNFGKAGFDPQITKSTKIKVDICGKTTPVTLKPSPSRILVAQSGVDNLNLVPDANDKAKGIFTYTKANQVGASAIKDKGTFFNLVVTDYYDASMNSPSSDPAKIGTATGTLSFLGRPTNTAGSPLGRLDALAASSYAYDISAAKGTISTDTAVRFWLYDYLDLYTIDANESGGVSR